MALLSLEILRARSKSICRACMKELDVPVPLDTKEGSTTLGNYDRNIF